VVIKSGEFKDIGSSMRPMSDRERVILQGAVDRLHRQFVRDLAKGRGLDEAKVAALADGRIYMGEEAVELGLADQLGNFEDAVRLAGEKAGIEGRPRLVYPKKDEDWLSGLLAGKSPLGRFLPVWTRHPLTFQYLYVPGH
jgi:protease-4